MMMVIMRRRISHGFFLLPATSALLLSAALLLFIGVLYHSNLHLYTQCFNLFMFLALAHDTHFLCWESQLR